MNIEWISDRQYFLEDVAKLWDWDHKIFILLDQGELCDLRAELNEWFDRENA